MEFISFIHDVWNSFLWILCNCRYVQSCFACDNYGKSSDEVSAWLLDKLRIYFRHKISLSIILLNAHMLLRNKNAYIRNHQSSMRCFISIFSQSCYDCSDLYDHSYERNNCLQGLKEQTKYVIIISRNIFCGNSVHNKSWFSKTVRISSARDGRPSSRNYASVYPKLN